MLFFGHVGLTVGVVQAFNELRNRRESARLIDLRIAALASLAPDLIDKPIGILFSEQVGKNTRLFGHSLLVACILGIILWIWRSKVKHPLAYWFAYLGHFVLDRMWIKNLPALFWPLLGFPPAEFIDIHMRVAMQLRMPYQVIGEVVGFTILTVFFLQHKLYERRRLNAFLRTGILK